MTDPGHHGGCEWCDPEAEDLSHRPPCTCPTPCGLARCRAIRSEDEGVTLVPDLNTHLLARYGA